MGHAASSPVLVGTMRSGDQRGGTQTSSLVRPHHPSHGHQRALSTQDSMQPLIKGFLCKMSSSSFRGWQRRWFVLRKYLHDNTWNYEVRYWRSEKDEKKNKAMRGRFPIHQVLKVAAQTTSGRKNSFSILVSTTSGKKVDRRHKRTYYLDSDSEEEKARWIACLTAAVEEERESEDDEEDETE